MLAILIKRCRCGKEERYQTDVPHQSLDRLADSAGWVPIPGNRMYSKCRECHYKEVGIEKSPD